METIKGKKVWTERNFVWTEQNEKDLERLFPTTDNKELEKFFGKKSAAIRSKAFLMGLKKEGRIYTKEENVIILNNWGVLSPTEIAELINRKFKKKRSYWGIINKYRQLIGEKPLPLTTTGEQN